MTPHPPLPSPSQLAWHRAETNLFVHFGVNTFTGREWGDGRESPAIFNPQNLDCRQWARVAKEAGFVIGILTAKHHDGFCLWPTRTTDHSVKSSPWKNGGGDLVREFVEAFRAEGLKVGLYLSPWDRHEPCYGSEAYNDFYCSQLTELLTQYGELHEVWFDGACAEGPNGKVQRYDWPRYFALVRQLQPGAVTFGDGGTDVRWVGNERGFAGETCWATVNPTRVRFPGDSGIAQANDARASVDKEVYLNEGEAPDGQAAVVWSPAECDVSIRPGWFYHAEEDSQVRSVDNLLDLYLQSVGRNGTLLLNIPPRPDGLFAEADVSAVIGFRKRLREVFARDLAAGAVVSASSEVPDHPASHLIDGDPDTSWTPAAEQDHAVVELSLPAVTSVGLIVLGEAIRCGQRIAGHLVEVTDAEGNWRRVAEGTTIGNKRIHRFPAVETTRVRVTITKALATPALATIGLFGPFGSSL
jgi:alpha-L-fucosidase